MAERCVDAPGVFERIGEDCDRKPGCPASPRLPSGRERRDCPIAEPGDVEEPSRWRSSENVGTELDGRTAEGVLDELVWGSLPLGVVPNRFDELLGNQLGNERLVVERFRVERFRVERLVLPVLAGGELPSR